MRKVYTHENRFIVANAKNILQANEIDVAVRNEHASSAVGELSLFDTWMELWVVNDGDYARAVSILENALSELGSPEWRCGGCGEVNDASFELCWNCQRDPFW
jgi:Putative prokaryotic signal transducing protein